MQFDPSEVTSRGHAIEMRIYAEDPVRFLPGPGEITRWSAPQGDGVRLDAGYREGNRVTVTYDPLMAKLIVRGGSREQVLNAAALAVSEFEIEGPKSNLRFFGELLADEEFRSGVYDTGLVSRMQARRQTTQAADQKPADSALAHRQIRRIE